MPLTRDEVGKILAACYDYPDKLNAVRLRALVLLLPYRGLGIRDAVALDRVRVRDGKLFRYTAKTGTAVWCPLPPPIIEARNAIPADGKYFSGRVNRTLKARWETGSEVCGGCSRWPGFPPDTPETRFTVELLPSGVPLERVSVLLGHQSVKVTGKHYAPWVRARQEQLEFYCGSGTGSGTNHRSQGSGELKRSNDLGDKSPIYRKPISSVRGTFAVRGKTRTW